jgi:hypothetical protein
MVFSGTLTSAANSGGQFVAIPELELADFPLVAGYVHDSLGEWLQLAVVVYDPMTISYPIYEVLIIYEGGVTILSTRSAGTAYRIVIIY